MMLVIKSIGLLLLIPTCVLSISGLFSEYNLYFDLTSHFRAYYGVATLISCLLLFISRTRVWGWISVALLMFNLSFLIPWYVEKPVAVSNDDIKLFVVNVLTSNDDYHKLITQIEAEDPDIIALIEIDQRWMDALDIIKTEYKYSKVVPRADNFGIGVFSRLPVTTASVEYFSASGTPSIVVAFETNVGDLTLIATHPLPPIGNTLYKARNEQLSGIAEGINHITGPLIVAGDLNTTMWSHHYKVLEQNGRLRSSRRGFGIGASWPAQFGLFGIPIDHVLVSGEINVVDSKIGQSVGSDHLPIIVRIGINDTPEH